MSASSRVRIEAKDPHLLRQVYIAHGIAMALEAMPQADDPHGKLPGSVLSRALVERVYADERAMLSAAVLKAVAKAGHDILRVKQVLNVIEGQGVFIEAEFFDLADMAEGASPTPQAQEGRG
jgi:hypothetical protein